MLTMYRMCRNFSGYSRHVKTPVSLKIRYENVNWIHLAQDTTIHWLALVNFTLNIWDAQQAEFYQLLLQ
jgi:hypothetical protein